MADSRFLDESGLSYLWTHASSSSDAGGIKERLALKADNSELSNYITISAANASYQPKDGDLTSIAGLTGTSGLLKKTAANTWTLDTANYSTTTGTVRSIKVEASAPLSVTPAAAVTTSGTFTITHDTSSVASGTYKSVTVDGYGHVTAGTNPTTLSGYGITDAYTSSAVDSVIASVLASIPTKVSELTNDAGYITSYTDEKVRQNYSDSATLGNYPIIMGNTVTTASSGTVTDEVRYTPAVYINPSNGSVTASRFNGKGAVYIGTCSAAAASTVKRVVCPEYNTLAVGDMLVVDFSITNSAAVSKLQLEIAHAASDTTPVASAKPIKQLYNHAISNLNNAADINESGVGVFVYDGTNWLLSNLNTNNTYTVYNASVVCTTSASVSEKAGTASYFGLGEDHYFQIMFRYDNTAQGPLTLNIASTGATPMYINGEASSSTNDTIPSGTYIGFYDATASVYHIRTDGVLPGKILEANHAATASSAIKAEQDGSGNIIAQTYSQIGHTHSQYAPLASPSFTGTPLAPTASAGTSTSQIATTSFVQTAIAAIPAGSDSHVDMALAGSSKGYLLGTTTTPQTGSAQSVTAIGDTSVYVQNGTITASDFALSSDSTKTLSGAYTLLDGVEALLAAI